MTKLKPPDTLLLLQIASKLDDLRERVEKLEKNDASHGASIWWLKAEVETICDYLTDDSEGSMLQ